MAYNTPVSKSEAYDESITEEFYSKAQAPISESVDFVCPQTKNVNQTAKTNMKISAQVSNPKPSVDQFDIYTHIRNIHKIIKQNIITDDDDLFQLVKQINNYIIKHPDMNSIDSKELNAEINESLIVEYYSRV